MKALLCIILSFALSANAQNFVKGYVVTEKGDTLKGEIKLNPKKEHEAYLKVAFKDANGAMKNFKPEKSKGYGYEGKQFIVMEWGGEKNFFLVLVKGYMTLYKMVGETVRMNESIYEDEYYIAVSGKEDLIQVKQKKFRKQLGDIMKDDPEIAASYTEEKDFNIDSAMEVIKKYNSSKGGL